MEYWQITQQRGQQTLAVWNQFAPAFMVKTLTLAEHQADIEALPVRAQERDTQQDQADAAAEERATLGMFIQALNVRVPQIIESNLDDDDPLHGDLDDIYAVSVDSEAGNLNRARKLISLWHTVNAQRAALNPALLELKRGSTGVAELAAAVQDYPDLQQAVEDQQALLSQKKSALRTLNRRADRNNKRWYAAWKNNFDEGTPEWEALAQITTEEGVPAPGRIDIEDLTQQGNKVSVLFAPGGGNHATSKQLLYQIVGADADFGHSALIVGLSQEAGPFSPAVTVIFKTRVSNSAATRESDVQTITMT